MGGLVKEIGCQIVTQFMSITIGVGGKDKTSDQIADIPDSYILADSMEFPVGKKLPLWIVGLLY